jgi:3-hydroxybutyryl-CoA dehydrogenase
VLNETLCRNRVWAAIKREALLVLAEGCCTVEALDELFMAHLKAGRAPFRYMDEIGLDVVLDIGEANFAHYLLLSLLSSPSYPQRSTTQRKEKVFQRLLDNCSENT